MPENSSCSSAGSCTKSSCEGCPSHNGGPQSFLVEQNKFSNIKHVIGVVSGKGGVGKSFVTSSLAVNMAKKGYKVGILDADITGPSIPKMFGAHDQILGDENGLMHPYETKEGIKLISVNLLMDNEEDPEHPLKNINICSVTFYLRHEDTDLFSRSMESHWQRGWTMEEIADLLAENGFALLEAVDDETDAPPTQDAERIVITAKKTGEQT